MSNILASFGVKPLSGPANYREWRYAVVDILDERGYLEIVSGESKRPDDTPTESNTGTAEAITKWERRASKARGTLGLLLDSAHREIYAEVRDPKELWEKLERRYHMAGRIRLGSGSCAVNCPW